MRLIEYVLCIANVFPSILNVVSTFRKFTVSSCSVEISMGAFTCGHLFTYESSGCVKANSKERIKGKGFSFAKRDMKQPESDTKTPLIKC